MGSQVLATIQVLGLWRAARGEYFARNDRSMNPRSVSLVLLGTLQRVWRTQYDVGSILLGARKRLSLPR